MGSGTPLRINFNDIDTSSFGVMDSSDVARLVSGGAAGTAHAIDSKISFTTSGEHWAVLGNITLRLQGKLTLGKNDYNFTGTLKSYDDFYDFNRSSHRGPLGAALTAIGGAHQGVPFDIEIRGMKPINESGAR